MCVCKMQEISPHSCRRSGFVFFAQSFHFFPNKTDFVIFNVENRGCGRMGLRKPKAVQAISPGKSGTMHAVLCTKNRSCVPSGTTSRQREGCARGKPEAVRAVCWGSWVRTGCPPQQTGEARSLRSKAENACAGRTCAQPLAKKRFSPWLQSKSSRLVAIKACFVSVAIQKLPVWL